MFAGTVIIWHRHECCFVLWILFGFWGFFIVWMWILSKIRWQVCLIAKQCLLPSSERCVSSVKLCNTYIDWKWNCPAKSQYIWLLCKPGVILFLKSATLNLNTITGMPSFALTATGAMLPSSASVSQDWLDSYVALDHSRSRTGFSFKMKNWMVVGPALSQFFC